MKKSFLILFLLTTLMFIACPPPDPEPQPEPEKPTLSKIDITDAAALFVEPAGTDAGKIFKIKKDLTTIEEVKYTNTDGSSADMGNLKASYVINAHNDYAIIGFAADPNKAKTYDFELIADKAYLVRKSDGKVFSLDEYGYPSCDAVMASGKYIYYPVGEIKEFNAKFGSAGPEGILTTYGNKLIRLDTETDTPTGKNIMPAETQAFSRYFIDRNNNVWYHDYSNDEPLPFISEDGRQGQYDYIFPLIGYAFDSIWASMTIGMYYDNANTQLAYTEVTNAGEPDIASSVYGYKNSDLEWGGDADQFMSTTPIIIYERDDKNICLYKKHMILYTQTGESTITVEAQPNGETFTLAQPLRFADGEDILTALCADSFVTCNIKTGTTSTIRESAPDAINSFCVRNNNMIVSKTENNVHSLYNHDTYSGATFKIGTTGGKVTLIDMEYISWEPLPYHSTIGY